MKVIAAVTTWFPSTPDPLLIGAAMYQDLMAGERKRLHKLVDSTAAELPKSETCEKLLFETMVVEGSPKEVIVEEAENLSEAVTWLESGLFPIVSNQAVSC